MNLAVQFQKDLSLLRQSNESVEVTTQLGRELLYRMKLNFGIHNSIENAQILKIKPLFNGIKEQVIRQA